MEQRIKLGETLLGNITTPMFAFGSKQTEHAKTVVIVSGVHGDEVSSVAGHVAFIRELRQHSYPDGFDGTIISIPFANPLGLFQGTRTELAAHCLKTEILKHAPDLVIDVHTMSSRSMPMIIIDRVKYSKIEERIVEFADQTGLPIVYDLAPAQYAKEDLTASLSGYMANSGIPAFTIEVPGGPYAHWEASEVVRKALWNVAINTKIVTKLTARVQGECYTVGTWMHDTKLRFNFRSEHRFARMSGPQASRAGLFLADAFPGLHYRAKQPIGTIIDSSCQDAEKIKMPADGYVSNIIDASIVASGDKLFELLVQEKK